MTPQELHNKYAKALGWSRYKVKVENCVSRMRQIVDQGKQLDEQWIIRSHGNPNLRGLDGKKEA